ncbi:MAG: GIY-YIG nuclease family protein [Polyangiales bacterium]
MHYVYVLRSAKDNDLYTGYTADLRQRHAAHQAGKVASTRHRRPLHLIYYEANLLAKDAKARELFLKSGSGKRFIRKQLVHYFSSVIFLIRGLVSRSRTSVNAESARRAN